MQEWARQPEAKKYREKLAEYQQKLLEDQCQAAYPDQDQSKVASWAVYYRGKYDAIQEVIEQLEKMKGEHDEQVRD